MARSLSSVSFGDLWKVWSFPSRDAFCGEGDGLLHFFKQTLSLSPRFVFSDSSRVYVEAMSDFSPKSVVVACRFAKGESHQRAFGSGSILRARTPARMPRGTSFQVCMT